MFCYLFVNWQRKFDVQKFYKFEVLWMNWMCLGFLVKCCFIFVDWKFQSYALLSFLFCYWIVVLSVLRWKKLACLLYEVMIFEFSKMKVALTCIECVLAFMKYFASYLWIDNFKGNFMFRICKNWKSYLWTECVPIFLECVA